MSEWRPIITAPKDGSEVLLYGQDGSVAISCWFKAHNFSAWIGYDNRKAAKPTHWMPLPEPPKENA